MQDGQSDAKPRRRVPIYAWIGVGLIFIGVSQAVTAILAHVFDADIALQWPAILLWLGFALVGVVLCLASYRRVRR